MISRRSFLSRTAKAGAAAFLLPTGCMPRAGEAPGVGVTLNDVHSGLNETRVSHVEVPRTVDELAAVLRSARDTGRPVSVSGGRHAMGGQQFGEDTTHISMNSLGRLVELDRERGLAEVEAGIRWPELHEALLTEQSGDAQPWGIRQKQSGADRLAVGGALAANAHGRRLNSPPIVEDVEAFTLLKPNGELARCSRTENADLFSLAIGGYGLFGIMTSVQLRLARRHRIERVVEVVDLRDLMEHFDRRIAEGFTFGDCQYATDYFSDDGLRRGVFSCYRPTDADLPLTAEWKHLGQSDWLELVRLAHVDRAVAFDTYSAYYLSTSGQTYWSDAHQFSTYVDDYHQILGAKLGHSANGGEMITEIYVPREELSRFLEAVRKDFQRSRADLIYGTIRLVEPESDTFLTWAREPWACVIFNLHVRHNPGAIAKASDEFRQLIDRGLELGGSYFLTYHRWATPEQVLTAYPNFREFLDRKRAYDPDGLFQSEWFRHYDSMFGANG